MADQVLIDSPFGKLVLTVDQVREAVARANEHGQEVIDDQFAAAYLDPSSD